MPLNKTTIKYKVIYVYLLSIDITLQLMQEKLNYIKNRKVI